MSARLSSIASLLALAASLGPIHAQPKIPANELPGHERDRFIDPFPRPPRNDLVIAVPQQPQSNRKCRTKHGAKKPIHRCRR